MRFEGANVTGGALRAGDAALVGGGAGVAFAIIEDAGLRKAFSFDLKKSVHDATLFGYVAAEAAYRDGGPWLAALLDYLRGNRDLLQATVARLPGIEMAHLESTYLAWIDCAGLGLADPHAHFLKHGLGVSPGADFGAPSFVRLNFGTQRSVLATALARMERAVLDANSGMAAARMAATSSGRKIDQQ